MRKNKSEGNLQKKRTLRKVKGRIDGEKYSFQNAAATFEGDLVLGRFVSLHLESFFVRSSSFLVEFVIFKNAFTSGR